MTGQVKEEILTRRGELGVSVRGGAVRFAPTLLRSEEFLQEAREFSFIDVSGSQQTLSLAPGSLAFTVCQTPVVYVLGDRVKIDIWFAGGRSISNGDRCLDLSTSQHIFDRDGQVTLVQVTVEK